MSKWKEGKIAITTLEIDGYFNDLMFNERLNADDANTLTRLEVFSACDVADLAIKKMMGRL